MIGPGREPFDLLTVPVSVDMNRLHRLFITDQMEIVKPIKALCEIAYLYDCDVLLISGRPSRLPGVESWFRISTPGRCQPVRIGKQLSDGRGQRPGVEEVGQGTEFDHGRLDEPLGFSRGARPGEVEGNAEGGYLLALYLHIHFASRPDLAPRFVEACRRWSPVA